MSQATPSLPLDQALGGRVWTPGVRILGLLFLVALGLIVWRFAVGLGPATALSDGYPWGLWIAFDVVVGTGLASGGYAVALLVFVLNRGRYHALVRPAMLTAALGYSIAILSLVVDVGRPWNFWKVPIAFGDWNSASPLLEVALCLALYTAVLWVEVSYVFMERWQRAPRSRLQAFSARVLPTFEKVLPWIVAGGVILPLMHQSSLGSLLVLTGGKLHPVWQTPLLPLLFLVTSFVMGMGAVAVEAALTSIRFKRRLESRRLAAVLRIAAVVLFAYVLLRFGDLAVRGVLGQVFAANLLALFFWLETVLFVVPAVMLWTQRDVLDARRLFRAAVLMLLAASLYRFDAFLVAFNPGMGWSYFPSVPELLITIGFVALEVILFLAIVRRFPVLRARPRTAAERRAR